MFCHSLEDMLGNIATRTPCAVGALLQVAVSSSHAESSVKYTLLPPEHEFIENNFKVALTTVHDLSTNDKSNLIRESNRSLLLLGLPPLTAIACKFPKLSSGRAFDTVVSAIDGKINSATGSSCSVGWDVVGCVVG